MHASLPPGTFGDLRDLSTRVDIEVRNARDLTADQFTVSKDFIREIGEEWAKSGLFPADVDIVPYKVNLYAQGGKFRKHVDTPSLSFAGTTEDDQTYVYHHHDTKMLSGVGFYGDQFHTLTPIENNGFRATVTFQVFHRQEVVSSSSLQKLKFQAIKDTMRPILEQFSGIGFLTDSQYSFEEDKLKGVDAYIHCAIAELQGELGPGSFHLTQECVVDKSYVFDDSYDDPSMESKVYRLRDADMQSYLTEQKPAPADPVHAAIIPVPYNPTDQKDRQPASALKPDSPPNDKDSQPTPPTGSIRFFSLSGGLEWKLKLQLSAERSGNEGRPYELNSLYIHQAFIVV